MLKKKALSYLTCCLETCHKKISFQLSLECLLKVICFVDKGSLEIALLSSKALIKITKVAGKYLEKYYLDAIISIIKEKLFSNNLLGINICACISNLAIAHGDLHTNRSNSKLFIILTYIF